MGPPLTGSSDPVIFFSASVTFEMFSELRTGLEAILREVVWNFLVGMGGIESELDCVLDRSLVEGEVLVRSEREEERKR